MRDFLTMERTENTEFSFCAIRVFRVKKNCILTTERTESTEMIS